MRLFVAAELPGDLRERLRAVQERLKEAALPVRWVRPEGIHLTLKFLGETPEMRLGEVTAALGPAGRGVAPFRLESGATVPFPERGTPRIVWVEVHGDVQAARRLAAVIDAALGRVGFLSEAREFRPHLTLGRVQGRGRADWRAALARVAGEGSVPFDVAEFVLFQSRTGPGGSLYTPLSRFPLGAVPAGEAAPGDDR